MRFRTGTVLKFAGAAILLYLVAGLAAPHVSAESYGKRLSNSLERALGRKVELRGPVRFSFFRGPAISAADVVIHEDPSIGFEPAAYMDNIEVRPSLWSLVAGRFVIASVRLEDATLNLAKSGDTWNFTSFVNRSVMSTAPAIHVRNGRINFKFGDTKSIFYLLGTDLDISPPASPRGGWSISCEAQPARTDRPALGLGAFALAGKWYLAPERVDLDLRIERTLVGELAVLMSGQAGGVHGVITSRLHLAGPLDGIGILGRLTLDDVHRWDLLPAKGQGWPMDIRGRLNLVAQQLELQSTSSVVPLTTRFRASDYLSRPHWGVTVTGNRFPIAPVLQLAADMGAQLPPRLRITGSIDGAIGYSDRGNWQGELVLHDAGVAIPDSPAVRFEQVHLMLDGGKVWLAPAIVRTPEDEQARLEATYSTTEDTLDLSISSEKMKVGSLRAQAALAAVPWLEQASDGVWSGQLRYHHEAEKSGWTGNLELTEGRLAVPGLAHSLEVASARVGIDGQRLAITRLIAKAGPIAFTGDYRYEPGTARPHRLRVSAAQVRAGDLEAELMPVLRRTPGLLARALGRASLPDWLRQRKLEGTVQIGDLEVAGAHLEGLRARLIWDVTHIDLAALRARLDRASLEGSLAVALAGQAPFYKLAVKVNGLDWQAGRLDAEGTLQSSGTGAQLLANLKSDGVFSGARLDFGTLSGTYALTWAAGAPHFRLTDLALQTDTGTYTGHGATQDDGRLLILLTNGSREMRMIGTLAALKVDEAGGPSVRSAQ
jgi:hypothetical protein